MRKFGFIILFLIYSVLITSSIFAQGIKRENILGVTVGYDYDFLRAGVSLVKSSQLYFSNARSAVTYNDNLTNNEKAFGSQVSIGRIFCFGLDASVFFNPKEGPLLSFKPKVGVGFFKYGEISYGYNMYTNGDRSWSLAIILNLPLYELTLKK